MRALSVLGDLRGWVKGGGGWSAGSFPEQWVVIEPKNTESSTEGYCTTCHMTCFVGSSSRRIPGHIREFNWLEPHLGNEMVFKTWQN